MGSVTIEPAPREIMEYQAIRLTVERHVARIVMVQEATSNRVSARMLRELQDACEAIGDDGSVRAVMLSAEGIDFCAGWAPDTLAEGFDLAPDPFGCFASLPQPIVCAVQGNALSAGLELALACDVRICGQDARFALPETRHGLLPRAGGSQRLPRLAGRGAALAMLLAGEELDAPGALRVGLVARVVAPDRLQDEAAAVAALMAARGPIATRYAKEAVNRGLDMTLEQGLRYETDLTVILQTTEDRAEGVRAFVEGKRAPDFKGA